MVTLTILVRENCKNIRLDSICCDWFWRLGIHNRRGGGACPEDYAGTGPSRNLTHFFGRCVRKSGRLARALRGKNSDRMLT